MMNSTTPIDFSFILESMKDLEMVTLLEKSLVHTALKKVSEVSAGKAVEFRYAKRDGRGFAQVNLDSENTLLGTVDLGRASCLIISVVNPLDPTDVSFTLNLIISTENAHALFGSCRYPRIFLDTSNQEEVNVSTVENGKIENPEKDVVLTSSEPLETVTSVTGKSVAVKDVQINSARLNVIAKDGNVTMNGVRTSGDLPKTTSSAAFSLETDSNISVKNSTFDQTGYNCIEIGLRNTAPKNIDISGLNFTADLSNNAILIFAHAENAVINIGNCKFGKISNAVRLSNRLNVPCTVNITNCTIEAWETDPIWAGMIICQDYTSKSKEDAISNNLFGNGKIKINIQNCTGPYGRIIAPANMSNILGNKNAKTQLAYVYANAYDNDDIVLYADHPEMYPTIRIS